LSSQGFKKTEWVLAAAPGRCRRHGHRPAIGAPIMLLVAAAVKLTSPAGVLSPGVSARTDASSSSTVPLDA
jgi:hypothetical protein